MSESHRSLISEPQVVTCSESDPSHQHHREPGALQSLAPTPTPSKRIDLSPVHLSRVASLTMSSHRIDRTMSRIFSCPCSFVFAMYWPTHVSCIYVWVSLCSPLPLPVLVDPNLCIFMPRCLCVSPRICRPLPGKFLLARYLWAHVRIGRPLPRVLSCSIVFVTAFVLIYPSIVYFTTQMSLCPFLPVLVDPSIVFFHAQVSLCPPSCLSTPVLCIFMPGVFVFAPCLSTPVSCIFNGQVSLGPPTYWSTPASYIVMPNCLCVCLLLLYPSSMNFHDHMSLFPHPYWSTPVSCIFIPMCLCVHHHFGQPLYRVFLLAMSLCPRPYWSNSVSYIVMPNCLCICHHISLYFSRVFSWSCVLVSASVLIEPCLRLQQTYLRIGRSLPPPRETTLLYWSTHDFISSNYAFHHCSSYGTVTFIVIKAWHSLLKTFVPERK